MQFIISNGDANVVATLKVSRQFGDFVGDNDDALASITPAWPARARHLTTYEAFEHLNLALRDNLFIDAYPD